MPRTTQVVLEVLAPSPTRNPTTVSGAGASQVTLEILANSLNNNIRVSQIILEVSVCQTEGTGGPGTAPTPESTPITTVWVCT